MKIFILLKQSLKAIFTNKGRSFLTVLGIVIGIGSVIALMSLGNGVKVYISNQIGALGTSTLTVMPGEGFSPNSGGGGIRAHQGGEGGFGGASSLTVEDFVLLSNKQNNPDLKLVSGTINGSAIYNDQRLNIHGTTPSQFQIVARPIQKGRVFDENDLSVKNKVIDLGADLSINLFGESDPIGQTITIGKDNYSVIGVFGKIDETSFQNPNLSAFIPYTSAMDSFGTDRFNTFSITAKDDNSVDRAKTEIEDTLLASHNIKDRKLADFSVSTSADLLSTVGSITGVLTALLSGIAAISLLVGGIGIMNIMLVSVTERTREIGLRKAVGAKTKDILVQFLIEAIFLTLAGGVLGIGLGWLLGAIAGHFVGFSAVLTNSAILLAVSISTFVGLVFGIYPAARAAKLNPIDALRYE